MNDNNNDIFLLGNNQGDEGLRAAISRYLHESRSVNCSSAQIIVGAGADYLLQLLAQILKYSSISGSIAMENPTYMQAYKIFKTMHYNVNPIPLDSSGISMEHLSKADSNIAYVTPSHQYPLGIVMPIKRRLELLQWANSSPARYIIEDDHDSEFRYKGKPIPSLQGIDSSSKVIYLGTFSRAIAPAIRIGYMVLPENLLDLYKRNFNFYSSTVSRVDQNIMKRFIEGGYFERHLNKTRKLYKNKHDLIIQNLKIFGDKIQIEGENAGLHLVIRFNTNLTENEIIELAAKNSIKLYGLREHYIPATETKNVINNTFSPTILLGYANVQEKDIQDGIRNLFNILIDSENE
jgi:GntR family transcriptional regulator/MocR family aminotransferase